MTEPGRKYLSKSGAARKPHRRKDDEGQEKLNRWSNRFSRRKLSQSQMLDFWRDAVDMAEGLDHDIIAGVAEKLANDAMGRQCIEQVLHSDYPGSDTSGSLKNDYLMNSFCFMWFMSHREVVNSFSIEKNISTLYKHLYGTNGSEAVKFFDTVTGQLSDEADTHNRWSKLWETKVLGRRFSLSHIIARVLECLRHTLRRNRTAGFGQGFKAVIERLSTLATLITSDDKFYPSINDSLGEVVHIQRRAMADVERKATSSIPQVQINEGDYPGHLSRFGPRHDNDSEDISSVKLLPTTSEIMSIRQDFLPPKDQSETDFLTGLDRLVDTQFRLIRHDYIKEVKETIKMVLEELSLAKVERRWAFSDGLQASGNLYWVLYRGVSVVSARFEVHGLQLQLKLFEPLLPIFRGGRRVGSRQLKAGDLGCFISSDDGVHQVTFITISGKASDYRVFVQVMDLEDHGLGFLFRQLSGPLRPQTQVLLVFSGIVPSQFLPILRNLQEIAFRGTHPLQKWAVPVPGNNLPRGSNTIHDENLSSAKTLHEKESYWDLKPILKDQADSAPMHKLSFLQTQQGVECIGQTTILDVGQLKGLVAGLSPGMSLIQGPPGTGKEFVGLQLVRILIHNKPQKPIGPIICIFSSQKALDKFLKKLLAAGIDNIIRVGDFSESPMLQSKGLKAVAYPSTKPHHERRQVFESYRDLDSLNLKMNTLLGDAFKYPYSWGCIKKILKEDFPGLYNQFRGEVDWEEWRGDYQGMLEGFGSLSDASTLQHSPEEVDSIEDIWELSEEERAQVMWHLLKSVSTARSATATQLVALSKEHRAETDQLEAQHNENTRRCLQKADVIAILATKIPEVTHVLTRVNAKFVICEEAGEILEGYLINAIPPSCQHLVQIGDYMQLRPPISSYFLCTESERGNKYRLDESMFERLINQRTLPVTQLKVQRRVREEITALLRCTLNEELQHHPTTTKCPDILGMAQNIFWLDHSIPEVKSNDTSTKILINDWEARMAHELVCHLVRQGQYKTKDIVVLTPYLSQLRILQKKLNSDFLTVLCAKDKEALARESLPQSATVEHNLGQRGSVTGSAFKDTLRVATVDNFSGEEASIVVVSLVRSNGKNKIGYMGSKNRIHVLLSRARQGLYIIGNAQTAYGKVPQWGKVYDFLQKRQAIGRYLGLRCPRHPTALIEIEEPEDFLQFSPEGGCGEPCDR